MSKIKFNSFSEYFVGLRWVLLIMIGFFTEIQAQVPPYVPTNGLVAWYPFNGNANDESGNVNNGIVYNSNLTSDRYNNTNSAYIFNGSNSRIMINQSSSLNTSTWAGISVSFWVYQTSYLNGQPFNLRASNQNDLAVYLLANAKPQASNFNSSLGFAFFVNSPDSIYLNSWNHVVVTQNYSSGKFLIYINGIKKDSTIKNLNLIPSPYINLGSRSSSAGLSNFFNGSMDDIGLWNRELSYQEVMALYNSCNSLPTVAILPLSNTIICQGDSVELMSSVQRAYNYKWYKNNTLIKNEIASKYIAKESGLYSLEIDSSGCSSRSLDLIVKVNSRPIVQCAIAPFVNIAQLKVPIIGTPLGGNFSGVGVLGNVFEPSLAGLGRKSILYTYTDINNCSNVAKGSTIVYDTIVCSVSVTDTLVINTNISTLTPPNNLNTIKIYPNPASTHITIDYGKYQSMNGYTLKIVNTLGAILYITQVNKQLSQIDLSTWSGNGIYYVQIIDSQNNIIHNKKIIIQ